MKKNLVVLFAIIASVLAVSCANTKLAENVEATSKEQEQVNKQFEKVYSSYQKNLILDNAETYKVVYGDKLTSIAKKFYGEDNGYYFPLIMLASNKVVLDPDLLLPGMELTVPSFEANVKNPEVATSLKSYFKEIADIYKEKKTATAPKTHENLLLISEQLGATTAETVTE
ncbi:LysM peptidoglycan-binding domain-containing protein [Treponema zioleckii]|uniref:LysM peptidoglycan-binding domain-containing protein n=1 Tax=Treponema zioleckii TaxID=331680 RepID=UPI00168AE1B5|nr:LysM peptidoglycan-binding domain-containing protein [Treponema zioleckii]